MESFVQHRCLNHGFREAVARCPECHHFFCRECITEHDDRVICASCLKQVSRSSARKSSFLAGISRSGFCLLGILIAWFFFFWFGRLLLAIPASFHDGTLWHHEAE